jgi:uncharacterized protein YprB with RNaseH-like and TPR domain
LSGSQDYIKRLEALNGGPLKNKVDPNKEVEDVRRRLLKSRNQKREAPASQPAQPITYQRDLPRSQPPRRSRDVGSGAPVVLEEAVPGQEVHVDGRGRAYLVTTRVAHVEEIQCPLCRMFKDGLADAGSILNHHLSTACKVEGVSPEEVVFVDAETTGLGNSPLFLIGTMLWEDDGLVVRQYLARNYAEEAAVTSLFVEQAEGKKLLVSFNGKSFDLPYIRTRAAANAVPFRVTASHLDLLHHCRRTWRGMLPNYKLQTLERHICGRTRFGDISGAEIPDAYHEYVRSANAVEIVEILKHNMLDLVTLADLMVRLPGEN